MTDMVMNQMDNLFYTKDMGRKKGDRVMMSSFSYSIIPFIAVLAITLMVVLSIPVTYVALILYFLMVAGLDMVIMGFVERQIENNA